MIAKKEKMKKEKLMEYFQILNHTLQNYKRAIPCLLIDLTLLDKNIDTLKQAIPNAMDFRIVVKSLPSVELIDYIMERANTRKLMVFHQPFLTDLSTRCDEQVDILLGKPMPIKTATYYYNHLPPNDLDFNPYQQIQWLVDTTERIEQYLNLAKHLGQKLRLNLEIDVGLHRGGFTNLADLTKALNLIQANDDTVEFSGLMGYDPHVVKLPSIVRSEQKAFNLSIEFYQQCKDLIQKDFPHLWRSDLTFNGAGSPTVSLHQKGNSPLNDVSAGSCLVKPTDFDIPTLSAYEPACFIATPILKKFAGTTLPAMEGMKNILSRVDKTNQQSYFVYGGFWKADYYFPPSAKQNSIFGASTNQTMINTVAAEALEVDDFVFLRPHQSEFVFLHFGNILAVRDGAIVEEWQLLQNY